MRDPAIAPKVDGQRHIPPGWAPDQRLMFAKTPGAVDVIDLVWLSPLRRGSVRQVNLQRRRPISRAWWLTPSRARGS